MPFYVVQNYTVYLTNKRYRRLRELALRDKDTLFKIRSTMKSTYGKAKEWEEAQSLMYDTLKEAYDVDEPSFILNWVHFDITGEEAKANTWDLLSDYCTYYGHSYLVDERSLSESMIMDMSGQSFKYPMGKIFLLVHEVKPRHWYWKYTAKMKNRYIRVVIDIERVYSIRGTLREFTIEFDDGRYLNLSKDILIAI